MSASDLDGDSLVIPSQLARLDQVRVWVASRAVAFGFGERTVADLEVAITEATSNVIRHAYENDEGHEVHLAVTADAEKITITITDFGKPFDRSAQPAVDLDIPHAGGYGLYLIEEIMDEVVWDRCQPVGNRSRLVKYRRSEDRG